jgi:thrombospondin motif-containing protein 6
MDERERYFLNGNWIVDWPGRYETSGVAFHYERVKDSEVVHSRGPLQQDLIVMVCPCSMAGPTRNLSFSLSLDRRSELDALRLSSFSYLSL